VSDDDDDDDDCDYDDDDDDDYVDNSLVHLYSPVFVGVGSLTAYLNPQCMLVSVCCHNLVTYAQRLQDLNSACLMF
jgi:hypothetical protein